MQKELQIEVTRAGSLYRARVAGDANFVFGDTPELATQRLKCDFRVYGRMPTRNSVQGQFLKGR